MTITIEEGLYAKLASDVALVSGRVYPLRLPQTVVLPALVYQRISTARTQTHDQSSSGLAQPRFQLTVYAETFNSAKSATNQVRSVLAGFKGSFTVGAETIAVGGILQEGEQDFFDQGSGLFYTASDYFVYHQE